MLAGIPGRRWWARPAGVQGHLVGGALNLLMLKIGSASDGVNATAITYMFTLGFAGVFYVLATRLALRACFWVKSVWSPANV